jgi:hypothetical protein
MALKMQLRISPSGRADNSFLFLSKGEKLHGVFIRIKPLAPKEQLISAKGKTLKRVAALVYHAF